MKLIFISLALIFSMEAFSQNAVIFNGDNVKALKNNLKLKDGQRIMGNDSDDPTAVAKEAEAGSIYMKTDGFVFAKQDNGSSTNWEQFAFLSDLQKTPDKIACFDSTGLLQSCDAWSVNPDYQGIFSYNTYEADTTATPMTTKINGHEVEITSLASSTDDNIIANTQHAHVDRTGNGFDIDGGIVLLDQNLSIEGSEFYGDVKLNNSGLVTDTDGGTVNDLQHNAEYISIEDNFTVSNSLYVDNKSIYIDPLASVNNVNGYLLYSNGNVGGNYNGLAIGHTGNVVGYYQGARVNVDGVTDGLTGISFLKQDDDTGSNIKGITSEVMAGNNSSVDLFFAQDQSDSTGAKYGINLGVTGDANNITAFNSYSDLTNDTVQNYSILSGTVDIDSTTNITGGVVGANLNIDNSSGGTVATYATGANIQLQGALPNPTALNIDLSSASASSGDFISINTNGGRIQLNSASVLQTGAGFQIHNLGFTNVTTPNAITGTSFLANAFPTNFNITENVDDGGGLGIGLTGFGYVNTLNVDVGDTVADFNAVTAGTSNQGSNAGTVQEYSGFNSTGILNFGGSLIADEVYHFRARAGSAGTDIWGFYIEDATAHNWLAGSLAIGGSATQVTNSDISLEIADKKALLFTPMTTAEKNALAAVEGMIVYDTTLGCNSTYDGSSWIDLCVDTTGITSLNGLTAGTQTFATGTSGTDFNISSATSTHTFNIPDASATNRGALTSTDWSTFNGKQSALVNSAGLASAINDETGTGVAVFSASPALTGNPTAPTQAPNDNSTKIATTAYVDAAVAGGATYDAIDFMGKLFPTTIWNGDYNPLASTPFHAQALSGTPLNGYPNNQISLDGFVCLTNNASNAAVQVQGVDVKNTTVIGSITGLSAGTTQNCVITPDARVVAFTRSVAPFLHIASFNTERITTLADITLTTPPTSTTSHIIDMTNSGSLIATTQTTSPFLLVYNRTTGGYNKMTDNATIPTTAVRSVAFSVDARFLAVTQTSAPYLIIYDLFSVTTSSYTTANTLAIGSDLSSQPQVYQMSFSHVNETGSSYLAVALSASPWVEIYEISNSGVVTKLPTWTNTLSSAPVLDFVDHNKLAITHSTTTAKIHEIDIATDTVTETSNTISNLSASYSQRLSFSPNGSSFTRGNRVMKSFGQTTHLGKIPKPVSFVPDPSSSNRLMP